MGRRRGRKTSVVPQMDFLLPWKFLPSHRPTKLTGKKATQAFERIKQTGLAGATPREIEQFYGWNENTASGRLSELRALDLARSTGARRNGQSVWVAVEVANR